MVVTLAAGVAVPLSRSRTRGHRRWLPRSRAESNPGALLRRCSSIAALQGSCWEDNLPLRSALRYPDPMDGLAGPESQPQISGAADFLGIRPVKFLGHRSGQVDLSPGSRIRWRSCRVAYGRT